MTPALLLIGFGVLGLCGFMAWKLSRMTPAGADAEKQELVRTNAELKANLERRSEEVGALAKEIEAERSQRNEQQGKSKQLFAEHTKLESKYEILAKERDALKKQIAEYEASEVAHEQEIERKLNQLQQAEQSFKDERARVIREDEETRRMEEEERDRIWAEHEKNVIATLTELCRQPQYAFSSYTNTALPDDFDGSLKPDFMIEFLDQYVIFDAKKSKNESLKKYIDNTIKNTVSKVKKNAKIAPMIYLVVPSEAVSELKVHHFVHDGYTLFVVSPEALPPILASLKRITAYEFAEQMDPQQRENIVQLIAELDFHINLRNAADILLTKMGTEILEKSERLDPMLAEEVALKKQPMNAKASLAASEIKKIVAKLSIQNDEADHLIAPRASIRKKDLESAEKLLTEGLF